MDASKLFQRWRRRLVKLDALLPGLLRSSCTEGTPEQIHQLRVVLRRMRLLARLGQPALGKPAVTTFHDWSRGISDSVGLMRDYDVTLEWLEQQPGTHSTGERERTRRNRLWKSRRARLTLPEPQLLAHLSPGKGTHKQKSRILKSFSKKLENLVRQAAKEGPIYFELSLVRRHEFRRRIRRWRYCRELTLPLRKQARDPTLKTLVRLQDALGDYQNRVVAGRILARRRHAGPDLKLTEALLKEQRVFQTQIRRQIKSVACLAAKIRRNGKRPPGV